ncbi:hypothetical protein H4R19_005458, partial [Coemansia spiralis]
RGAARGGSSSGQPAAPTPSIQAPSPVVVSSSSSNVQPGYTCETAQDGSKRLTLGEYSVSFTNMHGEAQSAAGFQSARAMVKPEPKAAVKAEPKVEAEAEAKAEPAAGKMNLDETQERISKMDIEKPLLIVAGAGSGKTSTLCARVVEMIRLGVDPARILVITFTNKAADELKTRIVKYMR